MTEKTPTYTGWYQPHARHDWTGEILNIKTGELVKEESLTKQSFKDECDINNIIRQYSQTGIFNHINERAAQGVYADLPSDLDYQSALNIIVQGREAFDTLPSSVRERFQNDPERFLSFMQDQDNQEEAIKLGLATRRAPPDPNEPQAPSTPSGAPPAPNGSKPA